VFGAGAAGISLFLWGAGTLGVARRHWDITFSEAPLTFDYPGAASLMLGLNGLSAVLAAVGGIMYVVVVVGSILFGKRIAASVARPGHPEAEAVATYGSAGTFHLPGTYVLVSVFFLSFVLYYFVNWKYLSQIWPLG
jgi:cytochrome c oxidase subunit 1